MDPLLAAVADALERHADEAAAAEQLSALRYYDDPVGFARDCIDWGAPGKALTPYQDDILGALPEHHRVAVRGPHGLGKTCLVAVAILWFVITREAAGRDWKCVTTAGAWRQLERYTWPEIHKWAKRIRWDQLGLKPWDTRAELLTLNIKLKHGTAFAVASDNAELIEGAHADSIMYVFDESKAIAPATFDAAEGAFSGADDDSEIEAFALAVSTPGEPNGRFYDIHRKAPGLDDWWTRHVKLHEAIAAKRVSQKWADQRRLQWGSGSAVYNNRVEGEFHSSDEDGVIPLSWVEHANELWKAWDEAGRPDVEGLQAVGVDVARTGADRTVLAIRHGFTLIELRRLPRQDTMQTTGTVKGVLDANESMTAVVDVIGIGAGVVDRLREQRCNADAFNSSAGTKRKDSSGELGFVNQRSAAWWNLRELLDPNNGHEVMLPPDDRLLGDLTAPHWKVMSGGKIKVESKDDLRDRLGRSPDDGDATVYSFWVRSAGWLDAYGIARCPNCSQTFMGELHRTHCPHCRRPHGGET